MPQPARPSGGAIFLDGSRGEGGGQILRTALSLSLLTGRPFRMTKIRANREKPGLRPQHQRAVEAAAAVAHAEVKGAEVGSCELLFQSKPYVPHDLELDIGTAGSTALVLQTLLLPIAMRAQSGVRVVLTGGTFNPKAPSFHFLDQTWRGLLSAMGMPLALSMPAAGFYPRGGGRLEAWIEPARPQAWICPDRGPLSSIRGIAGVCNLKDEISGRLRDRALRRLQDAGVRCEVQIEARRWAGPGQGSALTLVSHRNDQHPTSFTALGERGKPAEAVADEAVDELLGFERGLPGAVDQHSADQILLPLALAEGRSVYTVSEVTEHLRTNVETISKFLDRPIAIEEAGEDSPARVIVG